MGTGDSELIASGASAGILWLRSGRGSKISFCLWAGVQGFINDVPVVPSYFGAQRLLSVALYFGLLEHSYMLAAYLASLYAI